MAYATGRAAGFTAIPLIDLHDLRSDETGALERAAGGIDRASREVGFFYVTGHGVNTSAATHLLGSARRFFALPPREKQALAVDARHRGYVAPGGARMYAKVRPDLKESFVWGLELPADDPAITPERTLMGPNRWPTEVPGLREAVSAYFAAALGVGRDLARAFAVALDQPEDFFTRHFTRPLARGAVIHYPPQPPETGTDQFGVGPHTDYGFLTILWQDEVGGLEVLNAAGEWVAAPPVQGSFVVNVGDLLARWSNDRFASTPHRVINRSGRERYSIPVFYDPDWETVIDPAEVTGRSAGPAKYPPVVAGEHIRARFDRAFAHRGKGGEGEQDVAFLRP